MNFKEYLQFSEAMTLSAQDINLIKRRDDIECNFKHEGDTFWVFMKKDNDDVWHIDFMGPNGFDLTGISGGASYVIYNKMLSCIKKLFENYPVGGISFVSAVESMQVPYNLFYTNFLRPNPPKGAGFLKVNDTLYLSKDKVRELGYTGVVLPANRLRMVDLERIKNQKAIDRITDRINSGRAFATDHQTLQDLEAKYKQIGTKMQQIEKDYYAAMRKRADNMGLS